MAAVSVARSRLAVGAMFFLHGLCFSSWGSRIPAIQQKLSLSDAELGSLLLTIPVGSIISSILAPLLIERFGAKRLLTVGLLLYASALVGIGFAPTVPLIATFLLGFGCLSNAINVSVNTQAVGVETIMGSSILASFHGLWSVAGFTGAAIGTAMIAFGVVPGWHFVAVTALFLLILGCNVHALLPDPPQRSSGEKQPFIVRPNRMLLTLGAIAFCSMLCEGAMFDWSGLYCQNVIKADPAWIGMGYAAFMSAMAATRFIADRLKEAVGLHRMLTFSGLLISAGLGVLVLFPNMVVGVIGFLMVGAGTSSVVPLVVSQAGKETSVSPSLAIATVSTIGFFGFLVGPPLIGWIAGATSLRISFTIIALMGLCIAALTRRELRLLHAASREAKTGGGQAQLPEHPLERS